MKKVLLIGDSISLYYAPYLSSYLNGKAELHTKEGRREAFTDLDRPTGGNGGDSSMVLGYLLERDKENALDFDLFAFNCGLHDIKRIADGDCVISKEEYRENLEKILDLTGKRQLRTVFITTTNVEDERHNSRKQLGFTRYDKDVVEYNKIATEVMQAYKIPVIDLRLFTENLAGEKFIDHVHFVEAVRKLQAAFLAGEIDERL